MHCMGQAADQSDAACFLTRKQRRPDFQNASPTHLRVAAVQEPVDGGRIGLPRRLARDGGD